MGAELFPATQLHAHLLAATMRPADVAEVEALGMTPLEGVEKSVATSHNSVAIVLHGKVLAVGGYRLELVPALAPRLACAWVLTSCFVDSYPVAFHRASVEWLECIREWCDVLWNQVDARHTSSLAWLQRLGFRIVRTDAVGPLAMPFHFCVKEY